MCEDCFRLARENRVLKAELKEAQGHLLDRLKFLEGVKVTLGDLIRRAEGRHTEPCLANMACSGMPCSCGVREYRDAKTTEA